MDTNTFLQTHRVFNLEEAVKVLAPAGGRKATLERLKYAAARNRLKKLARGVYASVPPGVGAAKFQPDRFLVAAALRPDAVFATTRRLSCWAPRIPNGDYAPRTAPGVHNHSIWKASNYDFFPIQNRPLLFRLLDAFGQKGLWAAVGWFLETYRSTFYVSDDDLP